MLEIKYKNTFAIFFRHVASPQAHKVRRKPILSISNFQYVKIITTHKNLKDIVIFRK